MPLGRRRRILAGLLLLVFGLALAGVTWQLAATAIEAGRDPAPGRLVGVGDHSLHIHCVGRGSPTVVLESAEGGSSVDWQWVQSALAASTRVCAYDRAGFGWSEGGPRPRDAGRIVNELHTLLIRAGIRGPYVLAGHSIGGLYVRVFAARFPAEVAGVVLVDASHPDAWARGADCLPCLQQQTMIARYVAPLGLMRLYVAAMEVGRGLSPQERREEAAFLSTSRNWEAQDAELRSLPATIAEVRAAASLGNKPVEVVSATEHGGGGVQALWDKSQAELALLSTNSIQRVAAGSTHLGLVFEARHARIVSRAVMEVVEASRSGRAIGAVAQDGGRS